MNNFRYKIIDGPELSKDDPYYNVVKLMATTNKGQILCTVMDMELGEYKNSNVMTANDMKSFLEDGIKYFETFYEVNEERIIGTQWENLFMEEMHGDFTDKEITKEYVLIKFHLYMNLYKKMWNI